MSQESPDTVWLTTLFHAYAPSNVVEAIRSTETFTNEVYDITTTDGQRYFLKILKNQLPEAIATEATMQQHLRASGIGTPQYLAFTPDNYIGAVEGTRFILSEYIAGESPKVVTPNLIRSFGSTLARLHDSLQDVEIAANTMQWLNPERVQHDLEGFNGSAKASIQKLVDTGKVIFDLNLPQAVIHGDLWLSNVFAKDDEITTVFDLETAERTVRIIDLARTYTSLKFNSEYLLHDIATYLLDGYDTVAVRPLTRLERAKFATAIAYVCGGCATWHAIHGTRYMEPYVALGEEALST